MSAIRTIAGSRLGGPAGRWSGGAASRRPHLMTLTSLVNWFEDMVEKRRSRRALLWLTDAQLKDIGLSRADAVREARRSRWL